jgi:VWFA-related protein
MFARPHRSLNLGSCQLRTLCFSLAPLRLCLNIFLSVIAVALLCVSATAQEVDDTIRIKTRVVFLDALVKDKKTTLPISNLSQDNFQVLDDGKPRDLSYFTREGQARKPLALILILDVREDGAGRFLKRTEILKSMENQLAKLPPGDEVAIMAMDTGEDEKRLWLTEFTNDRTQIASALARVQAMCEAHSEDPHEFPADQQKTQQATTPAPSAETSDTTTAPAIQATTKPDPHDVISTEVITGKSGGTLTRTTRRDGSVDLKRVSKDGKVTVEFTEIYDMASAIRDAARKAQKVRPNSQASLVWISDGIAPIFFEDREASEQALIRDNVIFNSLTVELRTLFKFLMPIGKPIAGWLGVSLYGSAKYLAQRSGGDAVKVSQTKDYGAGLAEIIGNLTARYSLGFALAEDEIDDGRMHALEVRVNAKDEKGRNRKVLISSRQGYYMSSVSPKDTASAAAKP